MRLGVGIGIGRGGAIGEFPPGDVRTRLAQITISGLRSSVSPFIVQENSPGVTISALPAELGKEITTSAGGITLAGQQASIGVGGNIDTSLATFAISGNPAAIGSSTQISAAAAGVTIAGQQATVGGNQEVPAAAAGITVSGQQATIGENATPVLTSATFTDNNDGTPATLTLEYTGNVTGYRVYLATGSGTFDSDVPTAAELYAGAGATGAIEYADVAVGSTIEVVGFTSASESAVRIAACLIVSADGSAPSNVVVDTVSGLDFTAPTFSSAEIGNVDDTSLVVTLDSALYGSTSASDWDVQVNAVGATESAVSFTPGNTTVDITLSAAVENGDTVTVAYNGTGLADADGNDLATFTAQSVTNNVSGGAFSPRYIDGLFVTGGETNFTHTISYAKTGITTGNNLLVLVHWYTDTTGNITSVGLVGDTAVTTPAQAQNPGSGGHHTDWYLVPATASPGDLRIITGGGADVVIPSVEIFEIDSTWTVQNQDSAFTGGTSVTANITDVSGGLSVGYSWAVSGTQVIGGVTEPTADADSNAYAAGAGGFTDRATVGSAIGTGADARAVVSGTGADTARLAAATVWA